MENPKKLMIRNAISASNPNKTEKQIKIIIACVTENPLAMSLW